MTFSTDHLVLDLCEDECCFHDVSDTAGIDGDVLEGVPAFLEEGEAAFSLVAQAAQQNVAGFGVDVELAVAGLFHRVQDSRAAAFVAGIGEAGNCASHGRRAGRTSLRAEVMSWVEPGRMSDTQWGIPSGFMMPWTSPACS